MNNSFIPQHTETHQHTFIDKQQQVDERQMDRSELDKQTYTTSTTTTTTQGSQPPTPGEDQVIRQSDLPPQELVPLNNA